MRLKYVCHALLILFCLSTWLPNSTLPAGGIKWYAYNEGMALGENEKKRVFLHFYADWCYYCKKMAKETFHDPSVVSFLDENFIAIRVDVEKQKKITSSYDVRGVPTTWILEEKGDKIGPMLGYIPPGKFILMLKRMLNTPKGDKL